MSVFVSDTVLTAVILDVTFLRILSAECMQIEKSGVQEPVQLKLENCQFQIIYFVILK